MQRMHHHRRLGQGLALALAMTFGSAMAQELGDIAGKAKLSDTERAKRDADKVYQWIRFHADREAAKAAKAAKAAAPAPAARAAAPAAAPAAAAAAATAAKSRAEPAPATQPATAALAAVPASAQAAPELLASAAPSLSAASAVLPGPAALASQAPVAAPEPEPEDEPLELLQRVEPEFPRQLLRDGGKGSVLVRFTVKPDGSVSGAESLKASSPRLVRSVLEAVARWRFAPIREARSATVEVGFRSE
jgi:protein TonB